MDYYTHYNKLIERARTRIIETYTEHHHVVPLCLGGPDCVENIVSLTPEEHYIAHQLLVKIYPNETKLVFAAKMMTVNNNGLRPNNRLYGWLRRKHASAASLTLTGRKRGYSTSGSFQKGSTPWNKGKKGAQKSTRKGKTYEELYDQRKVKDLKKHLSSLRSGKPARNKGQVGKYKWCTDGHANKYVKVHEIPDGFWLGRTKQSGRFL